MADYKDYGFPDDEPSHAMKYLFPALLSLLNKEKNTCILDVGCGNGALAGMLLGRGFNVYGTDASEEGIAIAAQKHPGRFFVQDLSSDKLPQDLQHLKFDTIISTEVIEHIYDPHLFAVFCRQVLMLDGEIIISTPYHGYLKNLVLSVFNKWDAHADPLWRGGHIKLWSAKTLTRLLVDAKFEIISFKGCGRVPYLWNSMMIKAKAI